MYPSEIGCEVTKLNDVVAVITLNQNKISLIPKPIASFGNRFAYTKQCNAMQ